MKRSDTEFLKDSLSSAALWVEKGLSDLSMYRSSLSRLPGFAEYSLRSGGKRIRPFLVRSSCEAAAGDIDRSLAAACAVEMIHTYSLIHDDLPAMDDDDYRRGKPALHRVCGTKQALLAGDLLLIEAFGVLLDTPLGPGRVTRMVRHLASAAGPGYLVGGQYMDMFHPEDEDPARIHRMVLGKTSALIRASLELGVISGGGDDQLLSHVSREGDRLGYLFQLTDDILDISGNTEEMGKEVHKDSQQGKSNMVSLLGLDEAQKKARSLAEEIARSFSGISGNWEKVEALTLYLPDRRK